MLAPGRPAPDFRLPDLHGAETSLDQLLPHGPLLLVFFKVSCPTCQFTLPFLDRIASGGGLPVIGISQDNASRTEEFRSALALSFPLLIEAGARDYPVSNAYGITTVPSLFLIGKDGLIASAEHGFSRKGLEELGRSVKVNPFRPEDRVPESRPG